MNFKRFNGSTWETVQHKIYGSGTEQLASFPAMIQASGEQLTDYTIYGNTVQSGTPTPEAPVDVVGCGNLTDNLIPNTSTSNGWVLGYRNPNGTYSSDHKHGEWLYNGYIPVTPGVSVTISASYGGDLKSLSVYGWDGNKTFIQSAKMDIRDNYTNATYLAPDGVAYISLAIRTFCYSDTELVDAGWWIMLNTGSTALPYEPYGYKIPVTSGGVTTNLYLDAPLGAGDTLTYTDTGIALPTVDGDNIISFGTTVQPSAMSAAFKGWHPVQGAKQYDGNDWR